MPPKPIPGRHRYFSLPALLAILWLLLSCEGDTIVQSDDTSNPVPNLSSLSPGDATIGGSAFSLTLNGSSFIQGSVVMWNGEERATEYVSATQIRATVLATDIDPVSLEVQDTPIVDAAPRSADEHVTEAITILDDTVQVWVRNPAPGGGTSRALPFAQSAEDVAQVILQTVQTRKADVYSREMFQKQVVDYYGAEDMAAYEKKALAPR